jgi:hypothetical protein
MTEGLLSTHLPLVIVYPTHRPAKQRQLLAGMLRCSYRWLACLEVPAVYKRRGVNSVDRSFSRPCSTKATLTIIRERLAQPASPGVNTPQARAYLCQVNSIVDTMFLLSLLLTGATGTILVQAYKPPGSSHVWFQGVPNHRAHGLSSPSTASKPTWSSLPGRHGSWLPGRDARSSRPAYLRRYFLTQRPDNVKEQICLGAEDL